MEKNNQYAEKCLSKILQRTFLSHQILGEIFFITADHINYGDTGPAYVKLDAFFLSDKPKFCP